MRVSPRRVEMMIISSISSGGSERSEGLAGAMSQSGIQCREEGNSAQDASNLNAGRKRLDCCALDTDIEQMQLGHDNKLWCHNVLMFACCGCGQNVTVGSEQVSGYLGSCRRKPRKPAWLNAEP